ncbi:MAG TPA: class I SAM-dependent methyltransferase [Rhizomicrobium sp.]|nr:class I SAM-dependent methyltransferase [Rhizomicrobium sp.]
MRAGETSGRCALCASQDREIAQTQSLALLNRDEACKIDFCVCRSCGHLQQCPPVTPELMAHHYRSFASYEEFGNAEGLRAAPPSPHAQRFLNLVAALGLAPGRAYEVGCASGAMLHQFRERGWQVGGCDLSPSAISQAKDIFGISAELGGEEQALPAQKDLDLILACHVLEHLYDPPAALARFHAALAPHGHLVLEVPCATAPEMLPPGWFTFEHLHYYQPASLEWLLHRCGFEIVETRIDLTCQHYPVIAIAARRAVPQVSAAPDPSAGIRFAHCYAARDKLLWTATALRVACIQEPVFLYGAGIHTAQLLDHTGIGPKIIAIADRDRKKWGQTQAGKTVISPAALFAHPSPAPVIVSSYVSEKHIMATLLEGGIAPSRIIPLYSKPPAAAPARAAR